MFCLTAICYAIYIVAWLMGIESVERVGLCCRIGRIRVRSGRIRSGWVGKGGLHHMCIWRFLSLAFFM